MSILATSGNSAGEGSGVILTANGLILTNNHVVDGATTLTVRFDDGTTATATVVGTDAADDIAVISAENLSGLTPATLGTSADLQVGEAVVAIGAPLGLSSSVTSGIVSALNRPVQTSSADSQQTATSTGSMLNAIQTDAAINPGNSGGPLVDVSGDVIGVNSAIAQLPGGIQLGEQSGSIGLGFAIPSDQVRITAEQLIATGKAVHPVIGVLLDSRYTGEGVQVSKQPQNGAPPVTPGGPADRAGIKAGDVIIAVDGQPASSSDEFVVTIRAHAPGDTVTLTVRTGSKERQVKVVLEGSSQ